MKKNSLISRRAVLRGVGVTMALPWLEAMGSVEPVEDATPLAPKGPNRVVFMYVPSGVVMQNWTPETDGPLFTLTQILSPLKEVRSYCSVLTGLVNDKANPNGDGVGDFSRAVTAWLTGVHPLKTAAPPVRAGISADQVAAGGVGAKTRLASLEIGGDPTVMVGAMDGYSAIYSSTLAWKSATSPLPKMHHPQEIFDRLFGAGFTAAVDAEHKRSILDVVLTESRRLQNRVGNTDKQTLEEYFAAVREVEQRIARTRAAAAPGDVKDRDIPHNFAEHMRLLSDLVVLAFQTDSTRVVTHLVANEKSSRMYPEIGVNVAHNSILHHMNNPEKLAMLSKINTYHVEQLAYLLKRLKETKEGERTLLDNSMIVYGSGMADSGRHNHDNLPMLLCGGGAGTLKPGRHIRYDNVPVANLWLSLLDRMDSGVATFGDSTGRLKDI